MPIFEDFIPKEVSWLSFNERVLQEAADTDVPLINRIKFLGIYSSNLDEFFEVRVATLQRLETLGKKAIDIINNDPKVIQAEVLKKVLSLHKKYERIYRQILKELKQRNIYFINEKQLNTEQEKFVAEYFKNTLRPRLFPIMIDDRFKMPMLKDRAIYLIVMLYKKQNKKYKQYSLIEIPTDVLPRFIILPKVKKNQYLIYLDDIIRYGLNVIYATTGYDTFEAYDIKLTRDAELDIDDDISTSYLNKITKSLKKRKSGNPVRLGYDSSMPEEMLNYMLKKIKIKKDGTIIPGGRYHNFRDFMKFPDLINEKKSAKKKFISHRDLTPNKSIINIVSKKDILLYFPYHSFDNIIDLLREASIDPNVKSIKITLYRVAKVSIVVNALINAIKNRKEVIVLIELQARFDEKNNIYWANILQEEGATVIFGVAGLKIHSKLCVITRVERNNLLKHYCIIGTGNYNEITAKLYTDTYLLTSNRDISDEANKLFEFFEKNYKVYNYKHLVVSPFGTRAALEKHIDHEIQNAKDGKYAAIDWKINNLSDQDIIRKLYEASQAGVKIRLIIRSMFSLIPGKKGISENIEARSIVDKYLEHSRMLFFHNGGNEICFISSADILPRNLNSRVEVTCPIYDPKIKQELRDIFEICWKDNEKARILDKEFKNKYNKAGEKKVRSQDEVYKYLKKKHTKP